MIGRPRILIVEDEWLLAEVVEDAVRGFGFDVVGPAPSVAVAAELVRTENIDAAILDVNLQHGETSLPLAAILTERDIPFVFLTGYQDCDIPARFRDRPMLQKPMKADALKTWLDRLLPFST